VAIWFETVKKATKQFIIICLLYLLVCRLVKCVFILGVLYTVEKIKYLNLICILKSFFIIFSDSEEEYEADEEDAQEVGYASEPAVGLSDVSMLFCYTWHQKYTIGVPDCNSLTLESPRVWILLKWLVD